MDLKNITPDIEWDKINGLLKLPHWQHSYFLVQHMNMKSSIVPHVKFALGLSRIDFDGGEPLQAGHLRGIQINDNPSASDGDLFQ